MRMLRFILPRCLLVRYGVPVRARIEYLPADFNHRATLWIYWNWNGTGRRLLISLPDFWR